MARIADYCIRASRRDPRESPDADQMLFEQIDRVLDGCSQNQPVSLHVQGTHWLQAWTFQPTEAVAACAGLGRRAADEAGAALRWAEGQMSTATIYFTAAVARLPGLAAAVYQCCENRAPVAVLSPAAVAQAAFDLAQRIERGDLPAGLFEPTAPLPVVERPDAPALLPFPGQENRAANEYP
jgi:hypothetical protein